MHIFHTDLYSVFCCNTKILWTTTSEHDYTKTASCPTRSLTGALAANKSALVIISNIYNIPVFMSGCGSERKKTRSNPNMMM